MANPQTTVTVKRCEPHSLNVKVQEADIGSIDSADPCPETNDSNHMSPETANKELIEDSSFPSKFTESPAAPSSTIPLQDLDTDCSFQAFHEGSFTDYNSTLRDGYCTGIGCQRSGTRNKEKRTIKTRHKVQKKKDVVISSKSSWSFRKFKKGIAIPPDTVIIQINPADTEERNCRSQLANQFSSLSWETHGHVKIPFSSFKRLMGCSKLAPSREEVVSLCCVSNCDHLNNMAAWYPCYGLFLGDGNQVCTVFPVYRASSANKNGRTALGTSVITLPQVGFLVDPQTGRTVPTAEDSSVGADRSTLVGNNSTILESHVQNRPFVWRPPFQICHFCGRSYGSASIGIHEKQCSESWKKDNCHLLHSHKCPRSGEDKTGVSVGCGEQSVGNEPRRDDVIPGSGESDYSLDATKKTSALFEPVHDQCNKCLKCGRTFLPSRLDLHTKNCRGFRKIW